MIPIAFNEKALHLSTFIAVSEFFSDSVQCLHEIQPMKYSQLVLQMLPKLPKTSSCLQNRVPVTAEQCWSFSAQLCSLLPSTCLPFCSFPASRPVLITIPVVYFIWQQVGMGSLAMGATQGERRDGGNVCISPDKHVGKQSMGRLWSSKSDHSALKSAV